jgi:hypothetical protein
MINFVLVHGAWHGGWCVAKLPCSHDVMVDLPKELAAELLSLA